MFRKKKVVMDVLRVKEPGKQFSSFNYGEPSAPHFYINRTIL